MNEEAVDERQSLISRLNKQSIPDKDDKRLMTMEFRGYMIYVGKNAITNESIVREHAHRDCLWLHAMGARGSHVVLCHGGKIAEFTDESIRRAGQIALRYSRSMARSVIFTRLTNVTKLPNASPGVFMPTQQVQIEIEETI